MQFCPFYHFWVAKILCTKIKSVVFSKKKILLSKIEWPCSIFAYLILKAQGEEFFNANVILLAKNHFCLYLFKNEKLMNLTFTPAAKLIKSCTQNWILCIGFGLQLVWEERYHNWNVHWGDQTQRGNFRILPFIIFGIAEKV